MNFIKFSRRSFAFLQSTTHRSNKRVFLDISVNNQPKGRLVFELYVKELPKTAENFYKLCEGSAKSTDGKTLTYKDSTFHRIVPGFMAQGGDIVKGNGTGNVSIYGKLFEDEGFKYSHDKAGKLSMANNGPNSNGSQFFVTTGEAPWLDDKHVVFGELVDGVHVLNEIEYSGTPTGQPKAKVVITNCGALETPSDDHHH